MKKSSPTLKDLDFIDMHKSGIKLPKLTYDSLANTMRRDCTFLESYGIMDHSLLLAILKVDKAAVGGGDSSPVASPTKIAPPLDAVAIAEGMLFGSWLVWGGVTSVWVWSTWVWV